MMIPATQIRSGTLVIYNKELHRVHEVVHKTPGNLRGFVQAKMRNLRYGAMIEHRFGSTDRVEKASLDEQGDGVPLLRLRRPPLHGPGDLRPGHALRRGHRRADARTCSPTRSIHVDFYDGNPVGIELPNTVTLKVVETQPGMKGATASASYKPATLETGLQVHGAAVHRGGDAIKVGHARQFVPRAGLSASDFALPAYADMA